MGLFNRRKKKQENERIYLDFRRLAFDSKPNATGENSGNAVLCVLIDMNANGFYTSLAAYRDGTCSQYFKDGGSVLRLGRKDEFVMQAVKRIIGDAGSAIKGMDIAEDFELPDNNCQTIYVITKDKKYKYTVDLKTVSAAPAEIKQLMLSQHNLTIEMKKHLG